MRIYIKTDEGKILKIPIPMWVLKLGTANWVKVLIKKGMKSKHSYNQEDIKLIELKGNESNDFTTTNHSINKSFEVIDSIDFKALRANLEILQSYKGLSIVDISSSDGTEVKIVI